MRESFLFVGYQLRIVSQSKFFATMADNINALYIPEDENLRKEFTPILKSSVLPFYVDSEENLVQLYKISRMDRLVGNRRVEIFRCAILKEDIPKAYCEFYDDNKKLTKVKLDYVYQIKEPNINYDFLGFDVLDISEGGGSDSAIHTYNIGIDNLNKNGLIDDINYALSIREESDRSIPYHRPFTIWEIGKIIEFQF